MAAVENLTVWFDRDFPFFQRIDFFWGLSWDTEKSLSHRSFCATFLWLFTGASNHTTVLCRGCFYTVFCLSVLKDSLLLDCHMCEAFFRQSDSALSKKKRIIVLFDLKDILLFLPFLTLDQYSCLNSSIRDFEIARPDILANMLSYHLSQSLIARRQFLVVRCKWCLKLFGPCPLTRMRLETTEVSSWTLSSCLPLEELSHFTSRADIIPFLTLDQLGLWNCVSVSSDRKVVLPYSSFFDN